MGNLQIATRVKQQSAKILKRIQVEEVLEQQNEAFINELLWKQLGEEELQEIKTKIDQYLRLENNPKHVKEAIENEVKELITLPYVEDLKEQPVSGFESSYGTSEDDIEESIKFQLSENLKIVILYFYLKENSLHNKEIEQNTLKSLSKKLIKRSPKESSQTILHSISTAFFMQSAGELKQSNPILISKILKDMQASLSSLEVSSLRTLDYEYFAYTEQALNSQREFLVKIANDTSCNEELRQLATKLLFVIGNLRASGEDYLAGFNLILEHQLSVDATKELNSAMNSLDSHKNQPQTEFIVNRENSEHFEIINVHEELPDFGKHVSIAFDKSFAYIYNQGVGIFKVGIRNTAYSKQGIVKMSSSKNVEYPCSLIEVNDKLYLHDESEKEKPLQRLSKDSLEVVSDLDLEKALSEHKRDDIRDPWNKPTLFASDIEMVENQFKEQSKPVRVLKGYPLFTDGQHIYTISTYYSKKEVVDSFHVEWYSPKSMRLLGDVKLILDEENKEQNEYSGELKTEADVLMKAVSNPKQSRLSCWSDGSYLVLHLPGDEKQKLFFFSLKTGARESHYISINKASSIAYDPVSSFYWCGECPCSLQSFNLITPLTPMTKIHAYIQKLEPLESTEESWSPLFDLLKFQSSPDIENMKTVSPETLLPHILHLMYKACISQSTNLWIAQLTSPDSNENNNLEATVNLMRGKFSPSITNFYILQLCKALSSTIRMNPDDYGQVYFLVFLLKELFRTMEVLQINLKDILASVDDQTMMRESVQESIDIIKGMDQPDLTCLCEQIEYMLLSTTGVGVDVSSINRLIQDVSEGKQGNSSILKYILEHQLDDLDATVSIFSEILRNRTTKLANNIANLTAGSLLDLRWESYDELCEDFIRSAAHHVLIVVFSPYMILDLESQAQKAKAQTLVQTKKAYFYKVFSKMWECATEVIKVGTSTVRTLSTHSTDHLLAVGGNLTSLMWQQNQSLKLIALYMAVFGSDKEASSETQTLRSWMALSKLLESIKEYCKVEEEIYDQASFEGLPSTELSKSFLSTVTFNLSKVLSRVWEPLEDESLFNNELNLFHMSFLCDCDLKAYFHELTEETQQSILDLLGLAENDRQTISEIFEWGQAPVIDETIENLVCMKDSTSINFLQYIQKLDYKVNGIKQMRQDDIDERIELIGVVYGILVKFYNLTDTFKELCEEFQKNQHDPEVEELAKLKEDPRFDDLYSLWCDASHVMSWFHDQLSKYASYHGYSLSDLKNQIDSKDESIKEPDDEHMDPQKLPHQLDEIAGGFRDLKKHLKEECIAKARFLFKFWMAEHIQMIENNGQRFILNQKVSSWMERSMMTRQIIRYFDSSLSSTMLPNIIETHTLNWIRSNISLRWAKSLFWLNKSWINTEYNLIQLSSNGLFTNYWYLPSLSEFTIELVGVLKDYLVHPKIKMILLQYTKFFSQINHYSEILKSGLFNMQNEKDIQTDTSELPMGMGMKSIKYFNSTKSMSSILIGTLSLHFKSALCKLHHYSSIKYIKHGMMLKNLYALIDQWWDVVFVQVERYWRLLNKFDPIDWKTFVKFKNKRIQNDQDHQNDFFVMRDLSQLMSNVDNSTAEEPQEQNEIEKMNKLYDDSVMLRLIKLMTCFKDFTADNEAFKQAYIDLMTNSRIESLIKLLLVCPNRIGLMVLDVLRSILFCKPDTLKVFDEATSIVINDKSVQQIMNTKSIINETGSLFWEFLLKLCITAYSTAEYETGTPSVLDPLLAKECCNMLSSFLNGQSPHILKEMLWKELDAFLVNPQSYSRSEVKVFSQIFAFNAKDPFEAGSMFTNSKGHSYIVCGYIASHYHSVEAMIGSFIKDTLGYSLMIPYSSYQTINSKVVWATKSDLALSSISFHDHETLSDCSFDHNQLGTFLLEQSRLERIVDVYSLLKISQNAKREMLIQQRYGLEILQLLMQSQGADVIKSLNEQTKCQLIEVLLARAISPSERPTIIPIKWQMTRVRAIENFALKYQISLFENSKCIISFRGTSLWLIKDIDVTTNEKLKKCIKLRSAMNYGSVAQNAHFTLYSYEEAATSRYSPDSIALIDDSTVDTVVKIAEIFNKVDIIIADELDLETVQNELKQINKEYALSKTIVVISGHDYQNVKEMMRKSDKQETAQTQNEEEKQPKEKMIHVKKDQDSPITPQELQYSPASNRNVIGMFRIGRNTNFKSKMKNLLKPDYRAQNGARHSPFSRRNRNLSDDNDSDDLGYFSQNSYRDGLFNRGKLSNKVHEEVDFKNYSDIHKMKPSTLKINYDMALEAYHKTLSVKTLALIIMSDDKAIFNHLFGSQKWSEMLMRFIVELSYTHASDQQESQEAKEYLGVLEKIIDHCTLDNMKFLEQFYQELILQSTAKAAYNAVTSKMNQSESAYWGTKTPYRPIQLGHLADTLTMFHTKIPGFVYKWENDFENLISSLLLIWVAVGVYHESSQKILIFLYNVIIPIAEHPENFDPELKSGLLKLKIVNAIAKKLFNFRPNITKVIETVSPNLLFEILLALRAIERACWPQKSIYIFPNHIVKLEKYQKVIAEIDNIDFASYLLFFRNELTRDERKPCEDLTTFNRMLDTPITWKLSIKEVKVLSVWLGNDCSIGRHQELIFSKDREGKNVIQKFSSNSLSDYIFRPKRKAGKIWSQSDHWYMHVLSDRRMLLAYGHETLGSPEEHSHKRGLEKLVGTGIYVRLMSTAPNYMVAIDSWKKLHYIGTKSTLGNSCSKLSKSSITMPDWSVSMISAGQDNVVIVTCDMKIYTDELESESNSGFERDSRHNGKFVYRPRPNEETEDIAYVYAGYNFHAYITTNGKLYATGHQFLQKFGLESNDDEYTQIQLPQGLIAKKMMWNKYETESNCCILLAEMHGKPQLLSFGFSEYGTLGQGEDIQNSDQFCIMRYDHHNIRFTDVKMFNNHCLAITSHGEVYGWGDNRSAQLGLKTLEPIFVPTPIDYFRDYIVNEVNVGKEFSVISASPKISQDVTSIFHLGKPYDSSIIPQDEDGIIKIVDLKGLSTKEIHTTEKGVFILSKGRPQASLQTDYHFGYTWDITGETPIVGTMHFYKDKEDKWHFLSHKGYENSKGQLPKIWFATKAWIDNIQSREWPELDVGVLLDDTQDQDYANYIAWVKMDGNPLLSMPKTNEEGIFDKEKHDINPLIFYRLSRPLKEEWSLPALELTKYHTCSGSSYLNVTISSKFGNCVNNNLIDFMRDKYSAIKAHLELVGTMHDEKIKLAYEKCMSRKKINFSGPKNAHLDCEEIKFSDPSLKDLPTEALFTRAGWITLVNESVSNCFKYLVRSHDILPRLMRPSDQSSFYKPLLNWIVAAKPYLLLDVKFQFVSSFYRSNAKMYKGSTLIVDIPHARRMEQTSKIDYDYSWSVSASLQKYAKQCDYKCFCGNKYDNDSFPIRFENEKESKIKEQCAHDVISRCIEEMFSQVIGLFALSNNSERWQDQDHKRAVIHTENWSKSKLEMYELFGAILGYSMATRAPLGVRFTTIFWKKLWNLPISQHDVELSDSQFVQKLNYELQMARNSPENFDKVGVKFVQRLGQNKVLLCQNGDNRLVTHENIQEYYDLSIKWFLDQDEKQMEAIKNGFDSVFPLNCLFLFFHQELESIIYGQEPSVELFKQAGMRQMLADKGDFYDRMWRVLESLSKEQLANYTRCTYGHARLPISIKLFKHHISPRTYGECIHPSFRRCKHYVLVPWYKSDEIARKMLLESIDFMLYHSKMINIAEEDVSLTHETVEFINEHIEYTEENSRGTRFEYRRRRSSSSDRNAFSLPRSRNYSSDEMRQIEEDLDSRDRSHAEGSHSDQNSSSNSRQGSEERKHPSSSFEFYRASNSPSNRRPFGGRAFNPGSRRDLQSSGFTGSNLFTRRDEQNPSQEFVQNDILDRGNALTDHTFTRVNGNRGTRRFLGSRAQNSRVNNVANRPTGSRLARGGAQEARPLAFGSSYRQPVGGLFRNSNRGQNRAFESPRSASSNESNNSGRYRH